MGVIIGAAVGGGAVLLIIVAVVYSRKASGNHVSEAKRKQSAADVDSSFSVDVQRHPENPTGDAHHVM
jgi:hypothetical protein